jgi:hypothetical protein
MLAAICCKHYLRTQRSVSSERDSYYTCGVMERVVFVSHAFATVFLIACAEPRPASRVPDVRAAYQQQPVSAASADELWHDASQVFEQRCVVCHGCYDAPCQLKLESFAGAERGATKVPVYDGSRLLEMAPTRLGIDAQLPGEWRNMGFHGVLPERENPLPERSVLLRMLELKRAHPLDDRART